MPEAPASLTQLLKDLESPLPEVRTAALRGLSSFPSLAILRAVRRVAGADPSVPVREAARQLLAVALGKIAQSSPGAEGPERLRALLQSPDPAVRARVAGALATAQEPEVPPLLAAALEAEKDPVAIVALLPAVAAAGGAAYTRQIAAHLASVDPRIRATAVEALEATGDAGALARLLPLLDDPHHRVRAMVARAVQAYDREAVLACVDRMLKDPEEVVARSALYVLRFFDGPISLPRLRDHLTVGSPAARKMAVDSVVFLARKGSAPAGQLLARLREVLGPATPDFADAPPVAQDLSSRLLSERQDLRVAAVREVVRTGREDLVPALRARLPVDTDNHVRATLISALGRMGVAEDAAAIAPMLASPDARVRANAVEAIGLLKPGRAVELLAPRLADESPRVRANAVVALHFTPGSTALATLREMAWHKDPKVAASAVWAAATIATPDTVEVLAGLARAPSPEVATRARNALTELAPVMREAQVALEKAARPAYATSGAIPTMRLGDRVSVLSQLSAEGATARLAALRELTKTADVGLMPAVRPLLADPDAAVRRGARETVRAILLSARPAGGAGQVEAAEARLRSGPAPAKQVLDGILDLALACGPKDTAAMLGRRLPGENDPFLRAQLVSSLALVGDASQVALIKAFLRDPDARVRANAVDALDLVGSTAEKKEAAACLADPDPRVRAAAITVALPTTKEPFLKALQDMLASPAVAERAAGLYALRSVTFDERYDLLRATYARETQPHLYETCADPLVREALARGRAAFEAALAELPAGPKRQLLETLERRVADAAEQAEAGAEAREDAASADAQSALFSRYQDTQAAGQLTPDVLRKALAKQVSPVDVAFLLEAAVQMKMPDIVDLSMPFTHAKDRRLRLAAAEALGKLSSPEASDCLGAMVRDKDSDVSRMALRQLAGFDTAAAVVGAQELLRSTAPEAIVRGLEVFEELGSAAQMPAVMELLERGAPPASAAVLSRLLRAWGDITTLAQIVQLHAKADPVARAPLAMLAAQLTAPLAQTAGQIAAKLAEGVSASKPAAGPASRSGASTTTTGALSRPTGRIVAGRPTKPTRPAPQLTLFERVKAHPQAKLLGVLLVLLALLAMRLLLAE